MHPIQLAVLHLRWRPLDPAEAQRWRLTPNPQISKISSNPLLSHRIARFQLCNPRHGDQGLQLVLDIYMFESLFGQMGSRPPGVIFKTCRDSELTTETRNDPFPFKYIEILPPVHPEPSPSSIRDFPGIQLTGIAWLSRNTSCHNDTRDLHPACWKVTSRRTYQICLSQTDSMRILLPNTVSLSILSSRLFYIPTLLVKLIFSFSLGFLSKEFFASSKPGASTPLPPCLVPLGKDAFACQHKKDSYEVV